MTSNSSVTPLKFDYTSDIVVLTLNFFVVSSNVAVQKVLVKPIFTSIVQVPAATLVIHGCFVYKSVVVNVPLPAL